MTNNWPPLGLSVHSKVAIYRTLPRRLIATTSRACFVAVVAPFVLPNYEEHGLWKTPAMIQENIRDFNNKNSVGKLKKSRNVGGE